ncbi:MAG: zinc-binding dehydrogenase, partial [Thermoanaerobaculum sp.]
GYVDYPEAVARGVDVVLDSVGGRLFRVGWRALRPDGRYVLFGFASAVGPRHIRYLKAALELLRMGMVFPSILVQSCKTLSGFNLSLVPHLAPHLAGRFQVLCESVAKGELKPVIGKLFPFSELPAAHAFLQGRASLGKVVVTVP